MKIEKPVVTEIYYSIKVGVEDFKKFMTFECPNDKKLTDQLEEITGVSELNWGGHFGPYVYFRIDFETQEDHDAALKLVQETLENFEFIKNGEE